MKPLYLNGAAVNRIRLEHDALRIVAEHRADTWFPLNRISRIILSGDMALSSKVLATCLSQNIPIVIAGQKGEFVGVCFGTNFQQQSLQSHVLELYESRAQLYILDNWFLGQQRQQILHLQKRFRLPRDLFETNEVKTRLDELICLEHRFYDWQNCLQKMLPMLAAQLTVLLRHFGFDSEVLRPAPASIGLLQHFLDLLEWKLWALAANGHLPSGTLRNQLIHYYQSHSSDIERFTRLQIDKLWHRFYEAQHEQE